MIVDGCRSLNSAPSSAHRTFGNATETKRQEILLSSSAYILDSAVEDGYWDSTISTPTLQLLDGVIGAYGNSSGAVVSSEEMGDDAVQK